MTHRVEDRQKGCRSCGAINFGPATECYNCGHDPPTEEP